MKELQAVIFDMDGLILDTEKTYSEGWRKGAAKYGVTLRDDFVADAAGRSVDNNVQALRDLGMADELIFKIRKEREDYFYQELESGSIAIKPHFLQLMEALKAAGIKTGVATSSYRDRVERVFQQFRFGPLFDVVVTGDEVPEVKPAPDIYDAVADRLGADKTGTLVLEDSVTGGKAAANAGISLILVPDQSAHQKQQIPEEFPHLLAVKTDLGEVLEWLRGNELV